jgi:hypothetical protein
LNVEVGIVGFNKMGGKCRRARLSDEYITYERFGLGTRKLLLSYASMLEKAETEGVRDAR